LITLRLDDDDNDDDDDDGRSELVKTINGPSLMMVIIMTINIDVMFMVSDKCYDHDDDR